MQPAKKRPRYDDEQARDINRLRQAAAERRRRKKAGGQAARPSQSSTWVERSSRSGLSASDAAGTPSLDSHVADPSRGRERPNRWRGDPAAWLALTAPDRAAAQGLLAARNADVAAHLYNAFVHRRRLAVWARRAGASEEVERDSPDAEHYIDEEEPASENSSAELSNREEAEDDGWTAWPLPPRELAACVRGASYANLDGGADRASDDYEQGSDDYESDGNGDGNHASSSDEDVEDGSNSEDEDSEDNQAHEVNHGGREENLVREDRQDREDGHDIDDSEDSSDSVIEGTDIYSPAKVEKPSQALEDLLTGTTLRLARNRFRQRRRFAVDSRKRKKKSLDETDRGKWPVASADEELSAYILRPNIRHLLTKVDSMLTILNDSGDDEMNSGGGSLVVANHDDNEEEYEEEDDDDDDATDPLVSGPRIKSEPEDARFTARSSEATVETLREKQTKAMRQTAMRSPSIQSAISSLPEAGKRRPGRPRKQRERLPGETAKEFRIRLARESHRRIPVFSHSDDDDNTDNEETQEGPTGTEGGESEESGKETEGEVHYLRDWRDVLGAAALAGFDRNVLARAAQRCADLFGQSMTLSTFDGGARNSSISEQPREAEELGQSEEPGQRRPRDGDDGERDTHEWPLLMSATRSLFTPRPAAARFAHLRQGSPQPGDEWEIESDDVEQPAITSYAHLRRRQDARNVGIQLEGSEEEDEDEDGQDGNQNAGQEDGEVESETDDSLKAWRQRGLRRFEARFRPWLRLPYRPHSQSLSQPATGENARRQGTKHPGTEQYIPRQATESPQPERGTSRQEVESPQVEQWYCPMPNCDRAGRGFAKRAKMVRHLKLVHGEDPAKWRGRRGKDLKPRKRRGNTAKLVAEATQTEAEGR